MVEVNGRPRRRSQLNRLIPLTFKVAEDRQEWLLGAPELEVEYATVFGETNDADERYREAITAD